jgi:hypothetical protein
MTMVAAVTSKQIVFANIQGTQTAVTNYTRWDTKVIRAIVTTWNFFQRVGNPQDLRVHYVLPPETELTIDALVYGHNNAHLYAAILAISLTLVLLLHHRRCRILTFSWLSFLVAWSPGVGLVNHGWSTFGADRYCYLPLAMLVPGITEVFCWVLLAQEGDCDWGGIGEGGGADTARVTEKHRKQKQQKTTLSEGGEHTGQGSVVLDTGTWKQLTCCFECYAS